MNKPVNALPVRLTLLFVSTLTVMAGATIAPSLPAMRQFFASVNNADFLVRLVLTAPALFIAIGAPIVGVLIDKFGRKPLLTLALAVYGIAGSSGLWLDSLGFILVGRALLGMSVAGVMVTATALIADYYVGAARGQFLGLQAAFMALGGVVFLTFGGFLADVNWRLPFLIYLVALILIPCVVFLLPEPIKNSSGDISSEETNTELPIAVIATTYIAALLSQIVFYMIPVQLPFYLKDLVNANASQSGLAIAFATFFSAVTSLLYQRIKSRFSFLSIYAIAFLNIAVGYGFISLAKSFPVVMGGLAITGLGLGLLTPNMTFCLTSITPQMARGRVLGGLTTSFFLGQFCSPLISQPLSLKVGLSATYGAGAVMMLVMSLITVIMLVRWK
ncbi:MFS transporter [Dulcicalothrix desertica PCC 7102]|uniref:MFS transporter n=1 Tax=Dulcicalothrix desertica PCC 7102 TaxID=232991 RepID=A0A433VLM9_9CYAN|nr:MFS transporter [Dulcicalothrix desertica]RUT07024.1 MFS transporter [Dulcicalothrix desertica PCC 7102]TWH61980.1 putative MFS family arabinose efflux permease [Dulcicalothrix desertica PCC 7102]